MAVRSIPLQGLSLFLLPLPWTLPRLINLQLAAPIALFQGGHPFFQPYAVLLKPCSIEPRMYVCVCCSAMCTLTFSLLDTSYSLILETYVWMNCEFTAHLMSVKIADFAIGCSVRNQLRTIRMSSIQRAYTIPLDYIPHSSHQGFSRSIVSFEHAVPALRLLQAC